MPNTGSGIDFRHGQQSEYNNKKSNNQLEANSIYFTTDTHRIQVGNMDFSTPLKDDGVTPLYANFENGVMETDDLTQVDASGIYKYDNDMYVANCTTSSWNKDCKVTFTYIGDSEVIRDIDYTLVTGDANIDAVQSVPLLKFYNDFGDMSGGTYLFLDISAGELLIYFNDIGDTSLFPIEEHSPISLAYPTEINLDSLLNGPSSIYVRGVGEDVCGNFEKVKQYFVMNDAIVDKISTESYVKDYVDTTLGAVATALSEI